MHRRLFHLYQRKRIININVNAAAAGLLAMLPAELILWLAQRSLDFKAAWPYSVIAIGSDIAFDVIIYFGLHWVANHWRPFRGRTEHERTVLEAKPPPFLRDAALVQIERAVLSPLFYVVAGSLMHLLQWKGLAPTQAFLLAFPSGLIVTRTIHTLWGLRTGRFHDHHTRALRQQQAAKSTSDAA